MMKKILISIVIKNNTSSISILKKSNELCHRKRQRSDLSFLLIAPAKKSSNNINLQNCNSNKSVKVFFREKTKPYHLFTQSI